MTMPSESPLDRLWRDYAEIFHEFDDLTLARWMSQTLGQLSGKCWRLSHPLVGSYRLAAQVGHERQIWHKKLASFPNTYSESSCCRSPLLPLFTREVGSSGLVCLHCNEVTVPTDELAAPLQEIYKAWAENYNSFHSVAHWDERQRTSLHQYDQALESAAREVEKLLIVAGKDLAPKLLDHYPAVIWEDQDECLSVRPEDIIIP